MNFDERSRRLDAELGILVDRPDLAREVADRFDAVAQLANSYLLGLGPPGAAGKTMLTWNTSEGGVPVSYKQEPRVDPWTSFRVEMLSLLRIDSQL